MGYGIGKNPRIRVLFDDVIANFVKNEWIRDMVSSLRSLQPVLAGLDRRGVRTGREYRTVGVSEGTEQDILGHFPHTGCPKKNCTPFDFMQRKTYKSHYAEMKSILFTNDQLRLWYIAYIEFFVQYWLSYRSEGNSVEIEPKLFRCLEVPMQKNFVQCLVHWLQGSL